MKYVQTLLVLIGTLYLTQARVLTYEEQIVYMDQEPGDLERVRFDWGNCDGNLPVQVISLDVQPDPIVMPGNININFNVQSDVSIQAPVRMEVLFKKRFAYLWFVVPCTDNVGTCTYDDVCEMVAQYQCPPEFEEYKIPCQCPVDAGSYVLPDSQLPMTFQPSIFEQGSYYAEVRMYQGDAEVGCISTHFAIV